MSFTPGTFQADGGLVYNEHGVCVAHAYCRSNLTGHEYFAEKYANARLFAAAKPLLEITEETSVVLGLLYTELLRRDPSFKNDAVTEFVKKIDATLKSIFPVTPVEVKNVG